MPSWPVVILGTLHVFAFVLLACVGIYFMIYGKPPSWLQTQQDTVPVQLLKKVAEGIYEAEEVVPQRGALHKRSKVRRTD